MAHLLLINPSYLRTYGSNHAGIANPVYPILSLAVLGGAARRACHRVSLLDLSYRSYDPHFLRNFIMTQKPDVVGITATTPLANQMRDISFLVKAISREIIVMGGGAHASSLPLETMQESLLDLVVRDEGDLTITEIMDGKPLSDIQGIIWRNRDGGLIENPRRPLVPYLDDLSMPAWDLYPIDNYRKKISKIIARNSPLTTIEFSRGCLFKCDFCASKQTMGLGYRKKSPERCAEEMAHLYRLGYREVLLTDDIFTSDQKWAKMVCEAIIKKQVKMAWTCTNGIRVDSADDELFMMMKKAGCYRVHFGFESGNDEVLKKFGKGGKASLAQGNKAVKLARQAGLETWGMFMFGLSADNENSMEDTIQFAKKINVDIKKFGITVPFPGTPMFNELRQRGLMHTFDWDQYNVYNEAEPIFDHPQLSWQKIKEAYRRAYLEAYYKNPVYIIRRLWRALKTHEFFWDIYFGIRFFLMLLKPKDSGMEEKYAYQEKWMALKSDDQKPALHSYQKAEQSTWKKLSKTANAFV